MPRRRAPRRTPSRAPRRRRASPPHGSTCRRWRAATRVRRSTARVGRTSAATRSSAPPASARFASVRPIEARSVSMPMDVYLQSSMGLNGRSNAVKKPRSSSFTMTRRPSAGPTTQARMCRPVAGQDEGQRDHDDALEREPHERAGREQARLVGGDEGDPHDEEGEDREDGGPRAAAPIRRDAPVGGVPAAPEPPDVAAERLGKQGERGGEGRAGQGRRHDTRRCDRQRDPLRRRDDLAPVASRQRRAHPREAATRPRGTRSARRRSRAPMRLPRGRRTR